MLVSYVVFAVAASGCVVNGKAFGPGASVGTGGSSAGASHSPSGEATRSTGTSASVSSGSEDGYRRVPALDSELPPYPDAPEDPWVAVSGDQPRRMKQSDAEVFGIRQNATTRCTAARDHCLPTQTWFIAKPSYDREMHAADVLPAILGTESPIS